MSFRNKLHYFLVKKLGISNKDALKLLCDKKICVNGVYTSANPTLLPEDEIVYENIVLQKPKKFKYIALYKPRGIETTLNKEIDNNLSTLLPFEGIYPVGRLDKDSEGLILLTDDGRLYDKILRKEYNTEKEYLIKVDKPINDEFLESMKNGVEIMGEKTLPALVIKLDDFHFKITLIQGLNRQIRRMCYKLSYEILILKRVRIGGLKLNNLEPGAWRETNKSEVLN